MYTLKLTKDSPYIRSFFIYNYIKDNIGAMDIPKGDRLIKFDYAEDGIIISFKSKKVFDIITKCYENDISKLIAEDPDFDNPVIIDNYNECVNIIIYNKCKNDFARLSDLTGMTDLDSITDTVLDLLRNRDFSFDWMLSTKGKFKSNEFLYIKDCYEENYSFAPC